MTDWIITAPQGGRRRAGRRWGEGHTPVPREEQSDALWKAVKNDPMLHIAQDTSSPAAVIETGVIRPADASTVEGPVDRTDAPLVAVADPALADPAAIESDGAASLDDLIEQAIRAFGPEDFTVGGEPRMNSLIDAVQKLAHPGGEEAGVVVETADRDRVFKVMIEAGFEAPAVKVGGE